MMKEKGCEKEASVTHLMSGYSPNYAIVAFRKVYQAQFRKRRNQIYTRSSIQYMYRQVRLLTPKLTPGR